MLTAEASREPSSRASPEVVVAPPPRTGSLACNTFPLTRWTGDAFDFLGGRPVLDFLATIAERGTTDEEKLRAPRDLAEWAAQSGLTQDVMTVTPGSWPLPSSCARAPTACSARGTTAPSRSRRTATGSTPPRGDGDPSPGCADGTVTRSGTLRGPRQGRRPPAPAPRGGVAR